MKHRLGLLSITLCALICLSTGRTAAQNYKNSISADPISLAWGFLNLTYENRIGATNSFTVFGSYWSYSNWTAFGIGGSYRWYFEIGDAKRPLQGLSAGPLVSFGFWDYATSSVHSYSGGTSAAIGGELAYKWVFGGFVVEPILRLAFNLASISGLDYRAYGLGVNLGYAW